MSRIEEALAKASQLRKGTSSDRRDAVPELPPSIGQRKMNRRWLYGIGIFLCLAACFGIYRSAEVVVTPAPAKPPVQVVSVKPPLAAPQPAPAESSTQKGRLPAAIPLHAPDAAYASAHPGWQRYLSESLEFRVFREKDTVKAIQVFSRQEKPIPGEFFTAFIGDIVGGNLFKVQSSEEKDGYLIERGTASDSVDVVVYREKSVRAIKAFVIAYL